MTRRGVATLIAALTVVLTVSSCASLTVNSLPQPGGGRGGYSIVVEFENVLNLPDRAKVVQGGTTVGMVTSVQLKDNHIDVRAQIDPTVVVLSNSRATLQQSTVLGDIYVALERPSPDDRSAPALLPDGRIPLSQTSSPPQLEDTIANLANFVGSGSVQRVQNSIIGINRITPSDREEFRNMVGRVAADLADVSNSIDTVNLWLQGVSGTADTMHRYLPVYGRWFSPAGLLGFDRASQVGGYIGTVVPSIGSIYSGGYWLVPMLNSLAGAVGAVQQTKWSFEDEAAGWRRLFTDYYFPADKYPAINITSIKGPDGSEMMNNVEDVLRILGAIP